jgi:catechol 2,3-dioxygenase-like lactoylglutathione lyase family enzyme
MGIHLGRVGHIGIHVNDVDRSIDFYRRVLGLGRVKTQARVASVENLEGIAHRESQIMLRIRWLDTP